MWARYDLTTRRLKHWSTVPFTTPVAPDEADRELPDGTVLPSGPVRLTADLAGLETDPTAPVLQPPRDRDLDLADAIELAGSFADFKAAFVKHLRGKDRGANR